MAQLFKGFLNLTKANVKEKLVKNKAGETGVWVSIWINDEPTNMATQWPCTLTSQKRINKTALKMFI